MNRFVSLVFLTAAMFAACWSSVSASEPAAVQAREKTQAPTSAQAVSPGYRLHKEDVVKITVWGEPNFSSAQEVDPAGCIHMNSVGSVHVEGLTAQESADKIKSALSKWVRDAKVQVELSQIYKAKVFVLGPGVLRPGTFEMKPGDRIMEALAQAGSYSDVADLANARLTHRGSNADIKVDLQKLFENGDMSQNLELQDGDSIFVPEDTLCRYAVVGEVQHQNQFRFKKNMRVMDAISNAGGATERGELKSTYVLRAGPKGPERIHVDMAKFMKKGDLAQNIDLHPGDVVYVPETKSINWDKVSKVLSAVVNTSWLFRIW